jgi:hypothetical protein
LSHRNNFDPLQREIVVTLYDVLRTEDHEAFLDMAQRLLEATATFVIVASGCDELDLMLDELAMLRQRLAHRAGCLWKPRPRKH